MNTEFSLANWKRSFFTIWGGQAFSLLGSSLAGFALVWWLTSTTGSATVLAFGTLMQVLPQILLGPLLGALVDRWNRRLVMIVSDSVIAAFSLGLALLFWQGKASFWHVYIILFVRAVGGVFHLLAMQASTPLMIPEKHLGRVAGANQTLQGVMNIVAPALGAVLLGIFPIYIVLLVDVGTALLAILPLLFISIPQPTPINADAPEEMEQVVSVPTRASLGQEMSEGLQFVWGWPGLRAIILLAMISNLMTIPAMSFLPLMVTRHFGGGVLEVGWMSTVQGAGLLCGGLLLAALLGPHAAFLVMASILTLQALLFADGGLLALGCNIFNLGALPCFVA